MRRTPHVLLLTALVAMTLTGLVRAVEDETPWLEVKGSEGPGAGTHVVLVSGDEEYRSEEALTQLAKILAKHHGFDCTVLYAINPDTGTIDPMNRGNIPGLETLAEADLMIIATRFRDLPDDQMAHVAAFVEAGKPVIGLRTATHAFDIAPGKTYARFGWNSRQEGWEGGFGRQILGETWVAHHGNHGSEATRGLIADGQEDHPIARGIDDGDIFGPTDVYTVRLPLPGDSRPIILGQVLEGMSPDDAPVSGAKNDPMMPVAWTKTYTTEDGATGRVFTTTMGSSTDLESAGVRRLLVNATYWAVGKEDQIPAESNVEIVGDYTPLPYKHGGHKTGVKPADLAGD